MKINEVNFLFCQNVLNCAKGIGHFNSVCALSRRMSLFSTGLEWQNGKLSLTTTNSEK